MLLMMSRQRRFGQFTIYIRRIRREKIVNELGKLGCKDGRGKVCWSCAKVSRILRNKTYMGMIGYRKSTVNNYLEKKRINILMRIILNM